MRAFEVLTVSYIYKGSNGQQPIPYSIEGRDITPT